jgi:hypothetical protein
MPDDRRGLVVVGTFVVLMGTMIFLVAADVIPQPDEKFGAPRWMVALFGLSFFFAGWYVLSLLLSAPITRQVLAYACGLTLITGGAIFTTWLAWTGGDPGRTTVSIGPFSLLLPRNVARSIGHVMIWFFAALNDALAVFLWFQALRGLLRRRLS